MWWDPFACLCRFCPSWPLLFCLVGWFGAVLLWAVLSLPSVVLVLCFAFSRAWPSLVVIALCWCFCLRGYGRLSVSSCPVCGWLGLLFAVVVWLLLAPSLPIDASFPCGWFLCGVLDQFFAGPSLWISGCFCDGLVALPSCWGVVVLCRPHFICLMAAKAFGPVWSLFLYTMMHVLLGCSVLPR